MKVTQKEDKILVECDCGNRHLIWIDDDGNISSKSRKKPGRKKVEKEDEPKNKSFFDKLNDILGSDDDDDEFEE